jgi:hypothetical protein
MYRKAVEENVDDNILTKLYIPRVHTLEREKIGAMVAHCWEQWWLIAGSNGGSFGGAMVAHWGSNGGSLVGSNGGSLVATPDCEAAVLDSNPAISPAYRGLPVLRWAAIWDGTLLKAVL